ncbi:MAG TPA: hypothetical protein VLA88_01250 [Candidatus Saccharimonadales bacterium]|nr:hypothetical protein [Candidatus Saccharimonadales bacterium]
MAIDFGGLALGLSALELRGECTPALGGHTSQAARTLQALLLEWKNNYWRHSLTLDWPAKAAVGGPDELNKFVDDEGLLPLFTNTPGLGLATLTRIAPQWGDDVRRYSTFIDHDMGRKVRFQAVHLTGLGVMHYKLTRSQLPLASIGLEGGLQLWLCQLPVMPDYLTLAEMVNHIARSPREPDPSRDSVTLPRFRLNRYTVIDLLQGMGVGLGSEFQCLNSVVQWCQIQVGAQTQEGSRPACASKTPVLFDEPFSGYFTLNGESQVPFGAFQACPDTWIHV